MTDNDNEFLMALYNEMFKLLLAVAISHIEDFHRAEELVQDTFLIAARKIDTVRCSKNPHGWLRNTLINLIKHEIRARIRIAKQIVSFETLNDNEQPSKSDDNIFEIMSMFNEKEREMLRKFYIEGLTITELANELEINYDACRKRLAKIKEKLNSDA